MAKHRNRTQEPERFDPLGELSAVLRRHGLDFDTLLEHPDVDVVVSHVTRVVAQRLETADPLQRDALTTAMVLGWLTAVMDTLVAAARAQRDDGESPTRYVH